MNLPKVTLDYLDGPAVAEGGRSKAMLDAACQIRDAGASKHDAEQLLRRCAVQRDGLTEYELRSCLTGVFNSPPRAPIKANGNGNGKPRLIHTYMDRKGPMENPPPVVSTTCLPDCKKYVPAKDTEIPPPIENGHLKFLESMFKKGDIIRIVPGTSDESEIEKSKICGYLKEHPEGKGTTLTYDEWHDRFEKNWPIFESVHDYGQNGIYIAYNPTIPGGSKDSDVVEFRHALIEWDDISIQEQWSLITQSNIPCTAVIDTGGKSLHALVKVDARDRQEYDERVKYVHQHFETTGIKCDANNKNPAKFTRLPGAKRGERMQQLLALHIGAESFSAWNADIELEGIGQVSTPEELLAFDTTNDPNKVLGSRWACRGGSILWVGQSGIGKSSLTTQAMTCWAVGKDFFGIRGVRPLKSLVIQAENDQGDMAEMLQGVYGGMKDSLTQDQVALLKANIVFVRDAVHTGTSFCTVVRRLIDKYKPDMVWIDPCMSFVGDDVSKQVIASQFFRNMLNPIGIATGVVWMIVHHTGKPSTDPKSKANWNTTDFSYIGLGSSEMTNWARAVNVLRKIDETTFELMLAKRGRRAGARDISGALTISVWLKQSETSILWEQVPEPEQKKKKPKKDKGDEPEESEMVASVKPDKYDFDEFLAKKIKGMGYFSVKKIEELARAHFGISRCTFYVHWKKTWVNHPSLVHDPFEDNYVYKEGDPF